MRGYEGLNPFLQSVNSPINQKGFLPVTQNFPVPNDDINPSVPNYSLPGAEQYNPSLPSVQNNIIQVPSPFDFSSAIIPSNSIRYANLSADARSRISGTSIIYNQSSTSSRLLSETTGTIGVRFYAWCNTGTVQYDYYSVMMVSLTDPSLFVGLTGTAATAVKFSSGGLQLTAGTVVTGGGTQTLLFTITGWGRQLTPSFVNNGGNLNSAGIAVSVKQGTSSVFGLLTGVGINTTGHFVPGLN